MYHVCKEINFCYGHRLLNYNGPCAHPHGHNGKVEVHLSGSHLDSCDILFDFSKIREMVKNWIDQNLDHRMILKKEDPLVKILQDLNEPVYILNKNPTAETIAELIYNYCVSQKLPVEEIRLWETPSSYAAYREN